MEEEKKGLGWKVHAAIAIVIVLIIGFAVWRLIEWNKGNNYVVDENIKPEDFETEVYDEKFYVDPAVLAEHGDDGVNRILIIGDLSLVQESDGKTLLGNLKEGLDAEITVLNSYSSIVASYDLMDTAWTNRPSNAFTLYYIAYALTSHDLSYQERMEGMESFMGDQDKRDDFMNTLRSIDLDDYDTILFMYQDNDYYNCIPLGLNAFDNYCSYAGAWNMSLKLLRNTYPHLNLVVASSYPTYLDTDEGILYGTQTDFGAGNFSQYFMHQYISVMDACVSFIDNYYYRITEDRYDQYLTSRGLTGDGIDLVSGHIIDFLNNKQ